MVWCAHLAVSHAPVIQDLRGKEGSEGSLGVCRGALFPETWHTGMLIYIQGGLSLQGLSACSCASPLSRILALKDSSQQ